MGTYAANCPISRPNATMQYTNNVDMNGFAWDNLQGLFIPTDQQIDATIPPAPFIKPNTNNQTNKNTP
jgi:hypothetical protein